MSVPGAVTALSGCLPACSISTRWDTWFPRRNWGINCYRRLPGHADIEMFCPAKAEKIEHEPDSIAVHVTRPDADTDKDTDTVIRCKLLVIADGAFSTLRDLAGISTSIHDYRQMAIVSNVTVSKEHHNTAYERFIPGGLVAILPLKGKNRCVTVLVSPADQAEDHLQLDDEVI